MNEASLFSLFSRDAPREELCDKYGMIFTNMAHFQALIGIYAIHQIFEKNKLKLFFNKLYQPLPNLCQKLRAPPPILVENFPVSEFCCYNSAIYNCLEFISYYDDGLVYMRYHNDVKHAIFIQNEAVQSFALIMAYQSLAQLDYVNFFSPL